MIYPEANDLVRLIKACRKAGVSHLKLGDLEIRFGGQATSTTGPEGNPELPIVESPGQAQQQSPNEDIMRPLDEATARELELAQLMIDDPAAYEDEMIANHLEHQRVNTDERDQDSGY